MNSSRFKTNYGFTLIELLFVMAIMGVLATMALGVMKSAQDDAKEAATLSRIKQIESILAVELEDYEVRRLPVSVNLLAQYARAYPLYPNSGDPINIGVQVRNLKRRILQDIINAEIPRPLIQVDLAGVPIRDLDGNLQFEYNIDLGVFPTTQRAGTGMNNFTNWLNVNYEPSLRTTLNGVRSSRIQAWGNFSASLEPTDTTDPRYWENFDLPGEYLYQTLANMDFDGAPAIELLGNQAIGNSDDDGFLEVTDAWGEPLQLRIWQVNAVEVDTAGAPIAQNSDPTTDIWKDKTIAVDPTYPDVNFDIKDRDGIPQGYGVIDPTIPREITKLRFEVVSTRLPF